jgi:hypothetical protein
MIPGRMWIFGLWMCMNLRSEAGGSLWASIRNHRMQRGRGLQHSSRGDNLRQYFFVLP